MSTDTIKALRSLRPQDAARARELFPQQDRDQLLEDILTTNVSRRGSRDHASVQPRTSVWGTFARARRSVVLSGVGALSAMAIAVALLTGSAVSPQLAQAVSFRSSPDDSITAMVTNPFAAARELKADFAAHGFDISLKLVPVSPSLVGTVIFMDEPVGANITTLQIGQCPGNSCRIGLKIPKDFRGQAGFVIGRSAKPGEQYESVGQVTAEGEAMHGLTYKGKTVRAVLAMLRGRHVTVTQYRWQTKSKHGWYSHELPPSGVPGSWIVKDASPWAPGQVLLWVEPTQRSPYPGP